MLAVIVVPAQQLYDTLARFFALKQDLTRSATKVPANVHTTSVTVDSHAHLTLPTALVSGDGAAGSGVS